MCVKKSSPTTNFSEESLNKVIEIFNIHSNKELPISYIVNKTGYATLDVYKCIHELLTDGKIIKVFISDCPLCGKENFSSSEVNSITCQFCKEKYVPFRVNEKFKLVQFNDDI